MFEPTVRTTMLRRRALALTAALAAFMALAAPASADTPFDIDLTGRSNGHIQPLTSPGIATQGQVVTVPEGVGGIASFSFILFASPDVTFRGAVHAWNGTQATGPVLYLSEPRSLETMDETTVTFTPNISVEPGQYVIYATWSYDHDSNAGLGFGPWRIAPSALYDAGTFVQLSNGADVDALTERAWNSQNTNAAFALRFFPASDDLDPADPTEPVDTTDPVEPVDTTDPTDLADLALAAEPVVLEPTFAG